MKVLLLLPLLSLFAVAEKKPLPTVDHVDLSKYIGKWYEIARYPNTFEKKCTSDVTAEYTRRDDGKITVKNSCRKADGKLSVSEGTAKIVDPQTNAKLKVTFFWPFYGHYWIVDLAPDYRYAVVSEPDRKYLWILSRTPEMSTSDYEKVLERIKDLGLDPSLLIKPKQSPSDMPAR